MKWASAISERPSTDEALEECCEAVRTELGADTEPDLAIVFTSPHHDRASRPLTHTLRAQFPNAVVVGCTGAGVIGGGREVEDAPGLSLTVAVLPGVAIQGFHLSDTGLPSPDAAPDEWARLLGVESDAQPHFVVLADPFSMNSDALLSGLDYAFPSAAKIGGLASGGQRPGAHALYLNDKQFSDGAVGVALSGNVVVDTVVAQGCRAIGEPMRITGADRNLLLTVDGQPPLEILQQLFERMSRNEQELAQRNLFMGIAMDPLLENVGVGDFLIRNVIGIDPSRGAVAVGALLREGQLVQFHIRDAETSADDLRLSLSNYVSAVGDQSAMGALLFQCTGRGRYLYGHPDHDTDMFGEVIGALPLGGFFCNGEIGPVAGTTYLHGYTSSFAIFRPRTAAD